MMSARKAKRTTKHRVFKSRPPRYESLSARQKSTYEKLVALLFDLRTRKGTYSQLLRNHRVGSRTARKYLGRYLLKGAGGRIRASKADRLVRKLLFPMPFGDLPVTIRDSRQASKLSEYFNDRDKLLSGKMTAREFETKWRGARVAGQEVFADAPEIFRMANAGVLKMENLYASTGSAR